MLRRAKCALRDEDPVHWRSRLEPRRGIDDITGSHRLACVGARVERDQGLARPDADANIEPVGERDLADGQGSSHRTLGVILVRDGSAEERHDRVSDELLDSSAVPLELHLQPRVVRIEHGGDVLRIGLVSL